MLPEEGYKAVALTQALAAPEDERSDLQQLGAKASEAFNKAAGSVKDAFVEIDDNVLEYCSLDAKVSILSIYAVSVAHHGSRA